MPPRPSDSPIQPDLPVLAVLERLKDVLRSGTSAVLVAPPGAGKTTAVAPALLDEPWAGRGRILILAPRRLAARSAAARMAAQMGEPVGRTVGYTVRLDSKTSQHTRIEMMTQGVFTRRLLSDPELGGVSAVLFDEVHERSLDGDTGLTLALDARAGLRPDLRLVAMSATLDAGRFSPLLGQAPVIESLGRMFPVETVHVPRDQTVPLERQIAGVAGRALAEGDGDILVFLPGVAEIGRVQRALDERGLPAGASVHPLHGALEPAAQDEAVAPAAIGTRKLVLATSIAETSLTLPGIGAVVDCGLARHPVFEPDTGFTRLVTRRASRAAVDQRRGRAGRTGPGRCYRLWAEAETGSFPAFDQPEILAADLSPLVLTLAAWGVADPSALSWLDPPPLPAWSEARSLLERLGALDADGRLTGHGEALSGFGLPPRLAHMIVAAGQRFGQAATAAHLAALLSERGLGGNGADLGSRLEQLVRDGSPRARKARGQADSWAAQAGASRGARPDPHWAGPVLALAWPERIAKARDRRGGFVLAGGRAGEIDAAEVLAGVEFLAVAEMQGVASGARILSAARLDAAQLEMVAGDKITSGLVTHFDTQAGAMKARQVRRLGAIVLSRSPAAVPTGPALEAALLETVRAGGLDLLPMAGAGEGLRQRLAWLHALDPQAWPDVSDTALLAALDTWLAPALAGVRRLADVDPEEALLGLLDWRQRAELPGLVPARFATPAATVRPIDYGHAGGPMLSVRVGELYGLDTHPGIGPARSPLLLELLSPAQRPVALTGDLPGFWRGGWSDVRKDLKARYPRHVWPEQPWLADPTTRAKPRGT
jgi:ATP-dependent helicase HrpB